MDVLNIRCICIISNNVRCYGPAMNLYRIEERRHDKDSLLIVNTFNSNIHVAVKALIEMHDCSLA